MHFRAWSKIGQSFANAVIDRGTYEANQPGSTQYGLCDAAEGLDFLKPALLMIINPDTNPGWVYSWDIESQKGNDERVMACAFLATMPVDMIDEYIDVYYDDYEEPDRQGDGYYD